MGKVKSESSEESGNTTIKDEGLTYEEKLENVSIIAKPMASKKLMKKCYKLIKKASKQKNAMSNGLKDVQKAIRKGERGLLILAGDVTPVDIMCHLPGVCEDKDIPYCYTPSRRDLGDAFGVKRGCLMVLVKEGPDYKEAFDECKAEMKNLAVDL